MKNLMRILVLGGLLALVNAYGETGGKPDDLHVAEADQLPVNQVEESERLAEKLSMLSSQVDPYEIRVASALYGEKASQFVPAYLDTIQKFYGTGAVVPADFKCNAEGERAKINGWVETQTNERIKDLLAKGALNSMTRMVLVNAIYFKGDWAVQFEKNATKLGDFLTGAARKVSVPMMRRDKLKGGRYGAFNVDGSLFATPQRVSISSTPDPKTLYPDKGGFLVAELPCKGMDLSMVVLVPQDPDGLGALEKTLTSPNLQAWLTQLERRDMNVQMPKFKLETDYKEMKKALKELSDSGRIRNMKWLGVDLLGDEKFQKELSDCLERDARRELKEALESFGNMHNPKMNQLWKPFQKAFSATPTISKFNASLATYGLTISKVGCEKFELRKDSSDPKRHFSGSLWLDVATVNKAGLPDNARTIFDNPVLLFPNSFLPVLSRFEKAKIEKTLRGFYLRADTFPGFNQEYDPSNAGIYLNVAVRDPEEIPGFKDSSKVDGKVTERTVEFPRIGNGEVSLRIVFKFGSHASSEAVSAVGRDIETLIEQVTAARFSERLMDDKLAAVAEVVLRVRRLGGGEGSKYLWWDVEVLQILKNQSPDNFTGRLSVATESDKGGVPAGESTLYLERYNKIDKTLWKLAGGGASTGVSHLKKP